MEKKTVACQEALKKKTQDDKKSFKTIYARAKYPPFK